MAEKLVRIGKVSSINYSQGMIRVTYPDRDDSVTAEIPVFSFTDEYKMPKVGSQVFVLHLSNGSAAGIMMGHYWNEKNTPPVTGEGVFRKELAQAYGEAYFDYDGKERKLTVYADKIEIKGAASIKLDAPDISATSDVVADGVSVAGHTHTGVNGETGKPH